MSFNELLALEIVEHGSIDALPWGTTDGRQMTLGEMTDEHLDNCIMYHKGIRMILEGDFRASEINHKLEVVKYIEFKMRQLKAHRQDNKENK